MICYRNTTQKETDLIKVLCEYCRCVFSQLEPLFFNAVVEPTPRQQTLLNRTTFNCMISFLSKLISLNNPQIIKILLCCARTLSRRF
ncbi:hypothetical protein RCL_jg13849.t1 [Rhizophagus clarus]|uniref:Uncharacterized protein n=1 Tax=Rhizophagus clarus TaxID=94130 RepID=A0A8H3LMY0_9GLOM|nr:hypothetical protein RCL_jg13849.t1 [Rhizophagus clarus]